MKNKIKIYKDVKKIFIALYLTDYSRDNGGHWTDFVEVNTGVDIAPMCRWKNGNGEEVGNIYYTRQEKKINWY